MGLDSDDWPLEGSDVHGPVHDPREAGAALVGVRGSPFGSTARLFLPASMAGLPAKSAMVWVGPPLSASVPSPGSATPTWLPLLPLVRPLLPPPAPIRLNALAEETVPLPSSRDCRVLLPVRFRRC